MLVSTPQKIASPHRVPSDFARLARPKSCSYERPNKTFQELGKAACFPIELNSGEMVRSCCFLSGESDRFRRDPDDCEM